MPVVWVSSRGEDSKRVLKYNLPIGFDLSVEKLQKIRKECIAKRESLMALKKEAGKNGDRELAKSYKEEENEVLKEYRAVCLILPWYTSDVGGDCPVRDFYEIGPEMFPYLLQVEWKSEID